MKPKLYVTTRQHDSYIRVTDLSEIHRTARANARQTFEAHRWPLCMERDKLKSETDPLH